MTQGEVPTWAAQPGQPGVDPSASHNNEQGFISRNGRKIAVGATALVAIPAFAIAANIAGDNDDPIDIADMELSDINDDTFNDECDAPAYEGTDHNEILGQNAFYEYDLSGNNADIHKTLRNTLSRNLVGIASANMIIENDAQVVDFNSLHNSINAELQRISASDSARQTACEAVLASFATDLQRVTVTASTLIEVVPTYNSDGTLSDSVDFVEVDAKALYGNDKGIEGIWTDLKYGQASKVMTPEGRLFIVKTAGDEDGTVTVDTDGEPVTQDTTGEVVTGTTMSTTDDSGTNEQGDGGPGGDGGSGGQPGGGGPGCDPSKPSDGCPGEGPGPGGPGGPGTTSPNTTPNTTPTPTTVKPPTTTVWTTNPSTTIIVVDTTVPPTTPETTPPPTAPPTTIKPKDPPTSPTTAPAPPGF